MIAIFVIIALRQSYTDIRFHLIRNIDTGILFIAEAFLSNFGAIYSISVLGILVTISLVLRGSIGAGDIKLLAVLSGCFLSSPNLLTFFSYLILIAGLFSFAASVYRRSVKFSLPLAPFIWTAFFASYLPARTH